MTGPNDVVEALFTAAKLGRSDIIRSLVAEGGAEPNFVRGDDGSTALHVAVAYKNVDAIRTLLKLGAKLTIRGTGGKVKLLSPIELAKQQDEKIYYTFISEAIQALARDDVDTLAEMLDAGLDANCTDQSPEKNSLLHWATSFGSANCVNLLVQHAGDVNQRNALGATPLHEASLSNRADVVKTLLKSEVPANLTIQAEKGPAAGKTPFEVASSEEVQKLLSLGTPVADGQDGKGAASLDPYRKDSNPNRSIDNGLSVSNKGNELIATSRNDEMLEEQPKTAKYSSAEEREMLITQLKATIETLLEDRRTMEEMLEGKAVIEHIRALRQDCRTLREQVSYMESLIAQRDEQIATIVSERDGWKDRFDEKCRVLKELKMSRRGIEDALSLAHSQINAQQILLAGQEAKIRTLTHKHERQQEADTPAFVPKNAGLQSNAGLSVSKTAGGLAFDLSASQTHHRPPSDDENSTKVTSSSTRPSQTLAVDPQKVQVQPSRKGERPEGKPFWSLFSWLWPFDSEHDEESDDEDYTEDVV